MDTKHQKSISINCPHCLTKCQFAMLHSGLITCEVSKYPHAAYSCTNCRGLIVTKWEARYGSHYLATYYPLVGEWIPRMDLSLIVNDGAKEDFQEAIDCYNNGFYNACMVMTRRAIYQEMLTKKAVGGNLYEQIESTGISRQLKELLQKVKNFGNYGAHPDFALFDSDGEKIEDKKIFAKLSLEFLDRYFSDQYEIDALVKSSPKSKKELNSIK